MAKWSEQVNVYTSADAVAPTLGTLAPAGAQLRIDTGVAWANEPLVVFANNGAIQSVVSPYGAHYRVVSDASLVEWGGYSSEEVLVGYSRADVAGEPDAHRLYMVVSSDAFTYFSEFSGFSRAISTGAAGEFVAGLTAWGENATNRASVVVEANSLTGAQWTVTNDGSDDSSIIASCHATVGVSLVMTGFSLQGAVEVFRIDDEVGPVVTFSPFVTDNPLALPYLFDTSNAITQLGANLVAFRNNGVDQTVIDPYGGLVIGPYSTTWFGGPVGDGTALLCVRNYDDSSANFGFYVGNESPLNTKQVILAFSGGIDQYTLEVTCDAPAKAASFKVAGDSSTSTVALELIGPAGALTGLYPSIADGAGVKAYLFNTKDTLANATAQIVEVQNNVTQCFGVFADGSIKTGDPNGGSAARWRLGVRVADVTVHDATQYLQVDVDGTLYKVGLVTV